jgi:hypothetical protein
MSSAAQQKETQPGVMFIGSCNGKQNANAQSLVTGTHCISHENNFTYLISHERLSSFSLLIACIPEVPVQSNVLRNISIVHCMLRIPPTERDKLR